MAIFAVPKRDDSLAQQVEHNTFNVGVLGSSPRRITKEASGNRSLFCLCILRRNPEMQLPVHGDGAQRGSSVPGGGICPRLGVFLWMPQRNATACPHRWCLVWTHGARRDKCYFRVIVSPGFTSPLIIFSASGSSM